MTKFEKVCETLKKTQKIWLVTGAAGFIGSNITEKLLKLNQTVIALDDLSTGFQHNLDDIKANVTSEQWGNLTFVLGDVRDFTVCLRAMEGADYVLHQAALGSVPRSMDNPLLSHSVNVNGQLNILEAARISGVQNVVYAASSSTYGDHPGLPKVEDVIGKPLSPYAVTKYVNELYAQNYNMCYGLNTVGLRYFNVFGRRQDAKGAYAAVIPLWIESMIKGEPITINGDGETSRDFCYIDNVVQANILASVAPEQSVNTVYNIACGDRNTLNDLFSLIKMNLAKNALKYTENVIYGGFRQGDVRHSEADISRAKSALGFNPKFDLTSGLDASIKWYINELGPKSAK